MTTVIVLNTAILAVDRYKISQSETKLIEIVNFFCYAVYVVEMTLKLLAYGIKRYFRDSYNTFDFFIILISTADLIFTQSKLL